MKRFAWLTRMFILASLALMAGEMGAYADGQTKRVAEMYASTRIGNLANNATKDICSSQPKDFLEDVRVFYDLHRGDLLALGLRSPDYDSVNEVIRLIGKLPGEPKRDAIVSALADERVVQVFSRVEKQGEREASRRVIVWKLGELVRTVLRENDVRVDFDETKPDSVQKILTLLRQKQGVGETFSKPKGDKSQQ